MIKFYLGSSKYAMVLLFLASTMAWAQSRTVTGTVSSVDDNSVMPGVNVVEKGTTNGTVSDADGNYTISVGENATLVFTFVGYASQEVVVGNQTSVNVSIQQDNKMLNEVIVTGYSSQSKRNITGSISSIGAKDMPDVSPLSAERALQGKIPGVFISSEGTPGGGTMVRIRGFGTTNSNDPLYIIDGVPTTGNLASISPADIETISVLKDASAASIYGSRAANGVILITTKKGKANQSALTVTINKGVQDVPKDRYPDLMNPQQLADAFRTAQLNGSGAPSAVYGSSQTGILPDFINPIGFLGADGNSIVGLNGSTVTTLDKYDLNDNNADGGFQVMRANKEGTDWFDEALRTAQFTNVNVNFAGGGDKGTFYLGTEYFDQEGVIIHTNFKRFSARINSVGNAKSWLRLGQNLNVTYTEGNGLQNQDENGVLAMLYRMPNIVPVYDIQGNFAGNQTEQIGDARNPVGELFYNKDDTDKRIRTFGNVFLEVDLFSGLTFKTLAGIDYNTQYVTDWADINIGDLQTTRPNSYREWNRVTTSSIWTNTLNFSREIGESNFNVLVGAELIQNEFRQSVAGRNDFLTNYVDQRYFSLGFGTQFAAGDGTKNSLLGYFGKVDYSLSNKYLASVTVRRDGSSRFSDDYRWGVFPAASIGWIVSEESFLAGSDALGMLKLKAGWGQVGNQEIPDPNAFSSNLQSDINYASYPITGSSTSAAVGLDRSKRGNPNVTWETTETINVGLEAEFLKTFNFTFEWYNRETKDLLVDIAQPATAGFATSAFYNVGNVTNTGIELGLDYASDATKDFHYSIGVNFSTYRNKINELNSAPFFGDRAFDLQNFTISREGDAISSFYGYEVEGLFNNQAEITAHAKQGQAAVGSFKFRDANNDGVVNDLDRKIIGSPHPDFLYGFNVNLTYKNLTFSLTGSGVQGNEIFNATRYFTDFAITNGNASTRLLNAWTETNTNTNVPKLRDPELTNDRSFASTYYIEDGSFMRIRNIQLTYNLPAKLFGKILSSAKIYVQGQNLFTATKYSGLDPEINVRNFGNRANRGVGVDRGAYPIARSVSLGVSATF